MSSTTSGYNIRTKKNLMRRKLSTPSVLSVNTNLSGGSSGSNKTVTPDSIKRSRQRVLKEGTSQRSSTSGKAKMKNHARSIPAMPLGEERPDVFAFQVIEEEDGSERPVMAELEIEGTRRRPSVEASSSVSSSADPTFPKKNRTSREAYHQQWDDSPAAMHSFNSDSGISVRSNSLERRSPIMNQKYPIDRAFFDRSRPIIGENPDHISIPYADSAGGFHPYDEGPEFDADVYPEAYYQQAIPPRFPETGYYPPNEHLPPPNFIPLPAIPNQEGNMMKEPNRIGYSFLASNISSDGHGVLKPTYRKFESLNNQILLRLQKDLSELEAQLECIDAAIADTRKHAGKQREQRRPEYRNMTPLDWQRMEVIGRVSIKLDQYNRALSSYKNLCKGSDPASSGDVSLYREWVTEHASEVDIPTDFLEHLTDLTTILTKSELMEASPEKSTVATVFTVLLIIIAFKLVREFFPRMVIGLVVGVAMIYSNSPPPFTWDLGCFLNYIRRAAIYAMVIFILAIAVG